MSIYFGLYRFFPGSGIHTDDDIGKCMLRNDCGWFKLEPDQIDTVALYTKVWKIKEKVFNADLTLTSLGKNPDDYDLSTLCKTYDKEAKQVVVCIPKLNSLDEEDCLKICMSEFKTEEVESFGFLFKKNPIYEFVLKSSDLQLHQLVFDFNRIENQISYLGFDLLKTSFKIGKTFLSISSSSLSKHIC